MKKTETIADYLARGGKVTVVPPVEREVTQDVIKKSASGPPQLMTLEEADFFFGKAKKTLKTKKNKPVERIDLNALPPSLRTKFLSKLKENVDGEEIEGLEEDDAD